MHSEFKRDAVVMENNDFQFDFNIQSVFKKQKQFKYMETQEMTQLTVGKNYQVE